MTSHRPATVNLSIAELARHGGETGDHVDGWGLALYDDADVRLIRDPAPAADNAWVHCVRDNALRTTLAVGHIRKATIGARALKNTQPFRRELGGRMHVFAHNGDLADIGSLPLGGFRPVGDTDSEHAFCHLMSLLQPIWLERMPREDERIAVVSRFAARIGAMGPANFLYADGDLLIAHGHRRRGKDGIERPPGLHLLARRCPIERANERTAGVSIGRITPGPQQVTLIATVPLSDEAWSPLGDGEILAMRGGRVFFRSGPRVGPVAEFNA